MEKEKYESELSKILPSFSKEDILKVALYKINQGCCCQYVSDGIKEWYGVDISPAALSDALDHRSGLLPALERERNAWEHILHDETDNLTNIDRFYLQRKYGYDWKYMDAIFESYNNGRQIGQQTALIRESLSRGWITQEQAVQQLIDNTILSADEAQKEVKKILEEAKGEKEE